MPKSNCQFSGTGGQYFVTVYIHLFLLGSITLGIYSPWAWVRLFRLKASHTIINGKKVAFTGTGAQFLMIVLIQGLLTIITFGIYGPWAMCKFFKWRAQNTLVGNKPSQFIGTGSSLFCFYLIHLVILPILTLGIYYFLGIYRLYAWKEEHSRYGKEKTSFGGGFGGFLKVSLIGSMLNTITLNLFAPWALCMLYRWQISGLAVGDTKEVEHFPPVKINPILVIILFIISFIALLLIVMIIKNKFNEMKQFQQEAQITSIRPKEIVEKKPEEKRPLNFVHEIKKLDDFIKRGTKNADVYYNRALLYASKGDVTQAIIDYTKAIEIDKSHGDAYYNRGLAYVKKKRFQEAAKDFDAAIGLAPDSADAYCSRGNVNYKLVKLDSALEDYTTALKITPEDPDLYYNRSIVYRAMGDEPNATKDAEKAAQLRGKETKKDNKKQEGFTEKAPSVVWRERLSDAKIPKATAEGMINGDKFTVESAKLENGILTIRDGKNFFPNHAFMIFLFLKENESAEGNSYNITMSSVFGSPHIHMQWKPENKELPQTKIFTDDYVMRLDFGKVEGGKLKGKIYLCLSDDKKSFVGGSFTADVK